MNFTGQLRKRTVNLGGQRKNKAQILQSNLREREKRERQRKQEKSVKVIQDHIRKYIRLSETRAIFQQTWDDLLQESDIDTIVCRFCVFYSSTYKKNDRRLDQITKLTSLLTQQSVSALRPANIQSLLRTMIRLLPQLVVSSLDCTDCRVLEQALSVLEKVQPFSSKSSPVVLNGLIAQASWMIKTMANGASDLPPSLCRMIEMYSSVPTREFVQFLSSPSMEQLADFRINLASLSTYTDYSNLSIDSKIRLLTNVISTSRTMSVDMIICIARISSGIDVHLMTKADRAGPGRFQLEFQSRSVNHKVVSRRTMDALSRLYERDCVSFAAREIKDWHILSLLYGSLMSLIPSAKSTFIIYLIPSIFESSLNSILSSNLFQKFTAVQERSVLWASPQFQSEIFQDDSAFVFYDFQIFLELLRYRLIISNDFDFFTTYGFTREKFCKLSVFLKKFVLNLIWNGAKITTKPKYPHRKFASFKKLAINVLTQIYLKDARQKVLPEDVWHTNPAILQDIVSTITTYETRRESGTGDDSDSSSAESSDDSDREPSFEDSIVNSRKFTNGYLASLRADQSSRIQIYLNAPFFIPFKTRVEIFQALIENDKKNRGVASSHFFEQMMVRRQKATIRREHVLQDAFKAFDSLGETFKSQLSIRFVSETGTEVGVDGGGLTKEFLLLLVKDGFYNSQLFVESSNRELYPNPEIGVAYQHRLNSELCLQKLAYIRFLGKTIGKCLYDRTLVDITFASFFLTKFNTSYKNSFDDLRSLDSVLYDNLAKILHFSPTELEDLGLTFQTDEKVSDQFYMNERKNKGVSKDKVVSPGNTSGSKIISVNLIPNGENTFVNVSNRHKFVHEFSDYKLNRTLDAQSSAFLRGLYDLIPKDWLAMFNPYELQMLISGESDIDLMDLKANTVYSGGYSATDPTILDFWDVVENMSLENKRQLIKFVTSVPRAPLLGFGILKPKFAILAKGPHYDHLPTASTCVNLLKLPRYRTKEALQEKLLYAINAEAGFQLQ